MRNSRDRSSWNTVQAMNCCDYCGRQATTQIPTIPGRVCEVHAEKFWTGLLAYAREQHSAPNESPRYFGQQGREPADAAAGHR